MMSQRLLIAGILLTFVPNLKQLYNYLLLNKEDLTYLVFLLYLEEFLRYQSKAQHEM